MLVHFSLQSNRCHLRVRASLPSGRMVMCESTHCDGRAMGRDCVKVCSGLRGRDWGGGCPSSHLELAEQNALFYHIPVTGLMTFCSYRLLSLSPGHIVAVDHRYAFLAVLYKMYLEKSLFPHYRADNSMHYLSTITRTLLLCVEKGI